MLSKLDVPDVRKILLIKLNISAHRSPYVIYSLNLNLEKNVFTIIL